MKKSHAISAIALSLATAIVMNGCALFKTEGFNGPMVGKQAEKPAATLEDNAPAVTSGEDTGLSADEAIIDINFDDNDVDGFMVYTEGGTYELKARTIRCRNTASLDTVQGAGYE